MHKNTESFIKAIAQELIDNGFVLEDFLDAMKRPLTKLEMLVAIAGRDILTGGSSYEWNVFGLREKPHLIWWNRITWNDGQARPPKRLCQDRRGAKI